MEETMKPGGGNPLATTPIIGFNQGAGFQVVSSQYYLATGQAVKAMLLSILRPLLLMVPFIHMFSRIWGMDGILYAGPAADYLTAMIVALLLWYDRKKQRKILKADLYSSR